MSIYISIASYRDEMLKHTVLQALNKAKDPNGLSFGVVEQAYENERLKVSDALSKKIQYVGIDPRESRGACWARSLCMAMYNDEDWFFQIDAHSVFDQDWDEKLINAATECAKINPKCIVSSYPASFERKEGKIVRRMCREVLVHIVSSKAQQFEPKHSKLKFVATRVKRDTPIRGIHLAGGCLFTQGKFVYDVPYDPYMYFNGEEQAMALRAFTHGYDIFHVPHLPMHHLYGERPRHWDKDITQERVVHWGELQKRTTRRLEDLVNGKDMGVYGLGRVRTMQEYIEFSGIDYLNKKLSGRALRTAWEEEKKNDITIPPVSEPERQGYEATEVQP
jgi:hypothetical protein